MNAYLIIFLLCCIAFCIVFFLTWNSLHLALCEGNTFLDTLIVIIIIIICYYLRLPYNLMRFIASNNHFLTSA